MGVGEVVFLLNVWTVPKSEMHNILTVPTVKMHNARGILIFMNCWANTGCYAGADKNFLLCTWCIRHPISIDRNCNVGLT